MIKLKNLLTESHHIMDVVEIKNWKKHGFPVPWGWVAGFVYKDGPDQQSNVGMTFRKASDVVGVEIYVPDADSPKIQYEDLKLKTVPQKDLVTFKGKSYGDRITKLPTHLEKYYTKK